jgi:hypothetical protein
LANYAATVTAWSSTSGLDASVGFNFIGGGTTGVIITASGFFYVTGTSWAGIQANVYRDGSNLGAAFEISIPTGSGDFKTWSATFMDTPGIGYHTYSVSCSMAGSYQMYRTTIVVMESRR